MSSAGWALTEANTSTGQPKVDLASAFDASPNPYMLLDLELRYVGMNQAYLDVTQRQRSELLGRHITEAFDAGGDADNVAQLRASFDRVLATGQTDHIASLRYAIPVPDPSGGTRYEDRYWSCTHSPVRDAGGRLRYILQHTTDITELHQLRQQAAARVGIDRRVATKPLAALDAMVSGRVLQRAEDIQADNRRLEVERNRLFEMFMQAPGFVAVLAGPDYVFQMHNGAYAQLIGHRDIAGKPLRDALPEIASQGFIDLLDTVRVTGEAYEGRAAPIRLRREPDAPLETVYLDFIYQPIRDTTGTVVGVFVQGHDVTETVQSTERQRLMIDELNHRVKNTLATVQSIAMQTARSHLDPATFAESFQARLLALSHTHDLLTRSHWEGADLAHVLQHETEAHGEHRVLLNGPPVALAPAAALSLGMIFHELATNAAKYGALSAAAGRVLVDWSVADQADRRLTLNWREIGGPTPAPPARRGFGSRLIERNVHHDLGGSVEIAYETTGVMADFSIPLDRGANR
jgi:two-component sensor histidine kinase